MIINSSSSRTRIFNFLFHIALVVTLLVAQLSPQLDTTAVATPGEGIRNVGDFISLGANTVRELENSINVAGDEIRTTLETLHKGLNSLIKTLSQTYQDNLDITLNSLDAVTRNKLLELEVLMERTNQALQEDIKLVSQETQSIIRTISEEMQLTIQQLEESLKNLSIVVVEGTIYFVDRSIYQGILVISLVMLGFGLLIFVGLLFTQKMPTGLARSLVLIFFVLYISLFGLMAFVPPVRGYAMVYTGLGFREKIKEVPEQPRLVKITPKTIIIGETKEVTIFGENLLPQGKLPTIKIADQMLNVSASSEKQIVVTVSELNISEGSHTLEMLYNNHSETVRGVIELKSPQPQLQPPDLVIESFVIEPPSPIVRQNVQAKIVVKNQGQKAAEDFPIALRQDIGGALADGIKKTTLNGGQTQEYTVNFTYYIPGNFDAVAIVDSNSSVSETNEGNNSATIPVTVQAAPPRRASVSVTFTQITVHDDADPAGSGEIWLDFNVGGQPGRWPSSGTVDVESDRTYEINQTFEKILTEGEELTIFVKGTDEDDPGFPTYDDHDSLGEVSLKYESTNKWGRGSHSKKSNCPDGCYIIHYVIDVNWL